MLSLEGVKRFFWLLSHFYILFAGGKLRLGLVQRKTVIDKMGAPGK